MRESNETVPSIDYSTLDPGIRETVRRLRVAGFDTCDSGDGKTKLADGADLGEALDFPHVVMRCAPELIATEARRLLAFITDHGFCVEPVGRSTIWIQADYDPTNDIATIMLAGVSGSAWSSSGIRGQPAPSGVAAIVGAAPELPEDGGPWCENCGDALDAPERPCPQPAPGEPYKQCGRGGHMFRLETAAEGKIASFRCLSDNWGGSEKPSEETRDLASMLVRRLASLGHRPLHVAPMADGGIGLHYLDGDRAAHLDVYNEGGIVVVTRERTDDKSRYIETTDDDAVEEMRRFLNPNPLDTEVANLRGAVDMLNQAAAGHVAEIERLTKERDERGLRVLELAEEVVELEEAKTNAEAWRAPYLGAVIKATSLEAALEIKPTDHSEPLADRLLRVRLVVLGQQRAARAKEATLARWKRRATKAEQRIAALEQERDGLTLRLGARVKGQVVTNRYAKAAREMYESAPRKAAQAKGGR